MATQSESGSTDAKACPWCGRWALKDAACDYIFACGLDHTNTFHVGAGCGRTWCWQCGKKYCGQHHDPVTGKECAGARGHHDAFCCRAEAGFTQEGYCGGGHSSHCARRW